MYKEIENQLKQCTICPRECGVNRLDGEMGFCKTDHRIHLSNAIVHYGEEPQFTGEYGVGNFFFTSCNLSCVFCQNYQISVQRQGHVIEENEFIDYAFAFQKKRVSFIGLVSPTHQSVQIREALIKAKHAGLTVPILYNSNAYEKVSELKKWQGLIDVYLPDIKYSDDIAALKYSNAPGYVGFSQNAILEMYRQVGDIVIDPDTGLAKKGLWIRHLVLPNKLAGTWESLCFLSLEVSKKIGLSIMSQYEPVFRAKEFDQISRNILPKEYEEAVTMAYDLGFETVLAQDLENAPKNAIPDFNRQDVFHYN